MQKCNITYRDWTECQGFGSMFIGTTAHELVCQYHIPIAPVAFFTWHYRKFLTNLIFIEFEICAGNQ